jgi:hypothetical protein
MECDHLDEVTLEIQLAEVLPQHHPLVIFASGEVGLLIATPGAAEYSVA